LPGFYGPYGCILCRAISERGDVKKRIIRILSRYFALLNMNPGAGLVKKTGKAEDHGKKRLWINILLFIITFITTTLAGSQTAESAGSIILSGLPFSITIMAILLSHEMGHYLAARHFGIRATLPYFIPFPSIIGTMGAVIKIKSPIKDRKALFYIGAMGPVSGFILSLAAVIAGVYLSEIKPLPAVTDGFLPVFGDSYLFAFITEAIHGNIPAGYDIYLSPYAWAGWIGFLVTSLNLMPMGQLDGSHILYALLGRKQIFFGWAMFIALIILSFVWPGWIVWIIIALFFLMIGHPPVEDGAALSPGEKALGWICVIIFFLTFIPVPVRFI
jgi:membrane-associated protease RseP (regulator of RpoE activity)